MEDGGAMAAGKVVEEEGGAMAGAGEVARVPRCMFQGTCKCKRLQRWAQGPAPPPAGCGQASC